MPNRDPLYLFLCHLEWRKHRHVAEYNQLLAALHDVDPAIRQLAKSLLQRTSARPRDREARLQESATPAESSWED
jgi:hypothetical protein